MGESIVQFEFNIVSGFLKGETLRGDLRYRDESLKKAGTEHVPADSMQFIFRSQHLDQDTVDGPVLVTFVDGAFERISMSGGGKGRRFVVNTGRKAAQFTRKSEAALRGGAQYLAYYDRNGHYAGAGTVSYRPLTVPSLEDGLVSAVAGVKGCSTEAAIRLLVQHLYDSTSCTGGMYRGESYPELPNPWGPRGSEEDKDACTDTSSDPDHCPTQGRAIAPENASEVTLTWEWGLPLYVKPKDRCLLPLLEKLTELPDVPFLSKALLITNYSGWNSDHRGSDHCALALPMSTRVSLNAPTLSQVIRALYAVKSHKFDRWYELYAGCTVTESEHRITLQLDFDHGS